MKKPSGTFSFSVFAASAGVLLLAPMLAFAEATLSWTPLGVNIKSPVTIGVTTTGAYNDPVDGIGCEGPTLTNWAIHIVGQFAEFFGQVMGNTDKNASETFALGDDSYSVDIICSEAPVQGLNNGQSNNAALAGTFNVVPWSYSRSPWGFFPGSNMNISVGFDNFAQTGCDPSASAWRVAYYNTTGENLLYATPYAASDSLTVSYNASFPGGYYGTAEIECLIDGEIYSASMFLENGNGETIFMVPIGSANDEAVTLRSQRDLHPFPGITLHSPKAHQRVGKTAKVSYDVNFDNIDTSIPYDMRGLSISSVALSYRPTKAAASESTPIVSGLISKGEYAWNTEALNEGGYVMIVDALDTAERTTSLVSGAFIVDHTPPTFRLGFEPAVSRGEDVVISVDSEEELDEANPPKVRVAQQFAGPITLTTHGKGKHFEVVYSPVQGYDGEAKVTVVGSDAAGNASDLVVSGGYFYIGIEPPPKPVVISPLDRDVVSSATTSVTGRARAGTEIVLSVNGKEFSRKKTSESGEFLFENIPILKDFQRGVNAISVVALDQAGHQSEPALVRVKYNLPPALSIVSPKSGDILSRAAEVSARVQDENDDALRYTFEISDDGGETWNMLSKDTLDSTYKWRTMDYPDGEYALRVTVSDEYEKVVAISKGVVVRNYLPRIDFEREAKEVINRFSANISGTVYAEKSPATMQSPIEEIEYRLDGETTWNSVSLKEDQKGKFSVPFTFALNGLTEGKHVVSVRAKDARDFYGSASKILIVDMGPPSAPVVLFPKQDSVISTSDDEESERAGVQITVRGRTEPNALVTAVVGNAKPVDVQALADGSFALPGVTLREHGKNTILVTATDAAENVSPATKRDVTKNDPPMIQFRSPHSNRAIGGSAEIRWNISDSDGDITSPPSLSYRKGSSGVFTPIKKAITGDSYVWDVRNMREGDDYQIRLEVSDGSLVADEIITTTIDNTPPSIGAIGLEKTAFNKSFQLRFEVDADDRRSGVEYVEYAIRKESSAGAIASGQVSDEKEESTWYRALISKGYLTKRARATVKHPLVLSDGAYHVSVRSVDAAGNVSEPESKRIVVDTLPPRVGSYVLSRGSLVFYPRVAATGPDSPAKFVAPSGETLRFRISLQNDTESATLFLQPIQKNGAATSSQDIKPKEVDLEKERRNGLWEANIDLLELGEMQLFIAATDRLGNSSQKKLIGIIEASSRGYVVDGNGQPISGADIAVRVFNSDTGMFESWDGKQFGLSDTEETRADGSYAILLPRGTYQLVVEKGGYSSVKSQELHVQDPGYITAQFRLEEQGGFRGAMEGVLEAIDIF